MDDMTIYTTQGKHSINANEYNIEVYTDYNNNTLMGKVNLSSEASIYRIPKNTKTLYVKIPLIKKNIKDTLTKNKVNTFTTFDNTKPKFDINNSLPETFTPIEEYITNLAEDDIGRNYIQIGYDRCKLLK